MGCLSYFVYGHTGKKQTLRTTLLLFFINDCYGTEITSVEEVHRMFFQENPPYCQTAYEPYVTSHEEAMRFFFANSAWGKISNAKMFAIIVSRCYQIHVYLNQTLMYRFKKKHPIQTLHLQFDSKEKNFTLVYWAEKFQKIQRMMTYELRASKVIGEMVACGQFKRTDNVHTLEMDIVPETRSIIYTVFPLENYKQQQSIFIFRANAGYSRKCKFVASCQIDEKDYNPYFLLENSEKKPKRVRIIVVEADSYKSAQDILQIQCKLSVNSI